jgi:hypothetical protein
MLASIQESHLPSMDPYPPAKQMAPSNSPPWASFFELVLVLVLAPPEED